jgi:bifunctional DNase/RNase
MKNERVEVHVRSVLPISNGCAVFIGNDEKVFIIYVDQSVGAAIAMFMRGTVKERPLTHDLLANVFAGLGVKMQCIVINDLKNGTYFARMFLIQENELGKKLLEIDARPSDSIAMAIQQKCPIYVAKHVFDQVEDMSEVLNKMNQETNAESDEEEEEE